MSVKIYLAVGTYDGGVASYEMDLDIATTTTAASATTTKRATLQMIFASPIHQGSVRSLMVAATNQNKNSSSINNSKKTNNNSSSNKAHSNTTATTTAIDEQSMNDDDTVNHHALSNANTSSSSSSFLLVSCGYDEMIKLHDYSKHATCIGEIRLPTQYGTPNCSSFAPPYINHQNHKSNSSSSSHCLIGFIGGIDDATTTAGKPATTTGTTGGGSLVIYKKRDWSVQHVLRGHENGGVATIAVHPSGKLALSGGVNDGKIKVWDLQRGRLAYTNSIQPKKTPTKKEYDAIVCIVWSSDGELYGYCYGNHITVQHVATGRDVLDVELPSKVNQMCFIDGTDGMFVAAACNDGSLPVVAIESIESLPQQPQDDDDGDNEDDHQERRAIMAIEPVDGPIAGEERFKCIQTIYGYYVATANSAGVVSVMNLQGAVNMITSPSTTRDKDDDNDDDDDSADDDDDENEQELAVDIIDSVQIGNGARITCLVAWTTPLPAVTPDPNAVGATTDDTSKSIVIDDDDVYRNRNKKTKRSMTKPSSHLNVVELDAEALSKARTLVSQAKKIQHKKNAKRRKAAMN